MGKHVSFTFMESYCIDSFSQQISTENLLCAGHLDSVGLAVNKINSNSSHRFDSLLSLPTKKSLRAIHFIWSHFILFNVPWQERAVIDLSREVFVYILVFVQTVSFMSTETGRNQLCSQPLKWLPSAGILVVFWRPCLCSSPDWECLRAGVRGVVGLLYQ